MADQIKKYKAALGSHTEEWTEDEKAAVQEMTGSRFGEYTVEAIQPAKPADVPATTPAPRTAPVATPAPAKAE